MASFDIIMTVGLAYRRAWAERRYLLKMAMVPFLVKLACFTILSSFIDNPSLWLTGIILLPAFFFEGWLLSHWARTIMTGGAHRWPFRSSGDERKDVAELSSRAHGVMGGTVTFALINFLMAGYFAALFSGLPDMAETFDPQNPDPRIAVLGTIFIVSSLLLFRFVWVYVPLSVNVPLEVILGKLKPFTLTFRMIGLWLVCVIPAILVMQILGGGIVGMSGDADPSAISKTALLILRVAVDMIKNILCTAGMAYAFLIMLKGQKA